MSTTSNHAGARQRRRGRAGRRGARREDPSRNVPSFDDLPGVGDTANLRGRVPT
ncbi:hypothetical protein [Saccharopolyspora gregorii]|uniref:hypothetical protein n=1 Tax=Saccharopolyspora gregorii TaxID=33914 RepID=UPI0031ED53EA